MKQNWSRGKGKGGDMEGREMEEVGGWGKREG